MVIKDEALAIDWHAAGVGRHRDLLARIGRGFGVGEVGDFDIDRLQDRGEDGLIVGGTQAQVDLKDAFLQRRVFQAAGDFQHRGALGVRVKEGHFECHRTIDGLAVFLDEPTAVGKVEVRGASQGSGQGQRYDAGHS